MKILILMLTMLLTHFSYGQEKVSCEMLHALLKHEQAKKVFYFDKHEEVPIIFVDVSGYFKDCTISNNYNRKVEVTHDSSYLEQVNYSNVIINQLPKNGSVYKMSVYYKVRNAIFEVNFKRRDGKLVVTKFRGGHY